MYQNALNKEESLKMKDLKNQLYVALTRARNTMNLFCLDKKSAFDSLNLCEQKFGDLEDAIKTQIQNRQQIQSVDSQMTFALLHQQNQVWKI